MYWTDDEELDALGDALMDATVALRVAALHARARASAGTAFNDLVEGLLDAIVAAPTADLAARELDRLCTVLAETASTTEHLAARPTAQAAWNELLHARAELASAYQQAASLRWRAWAAAGRSGARTATGAQPAKGSPEWYSQRPDTR